MSTHIKSSRPAHRFYVALAMWKNAAMDVEAVCPDDDVDKYEDEVDRLADIEGELKEAVFKYATPDLIAVVAKLELAIHDPSWIQVDHIRNAIADLAGHADVKKSPAFCANFWLCQFEGQGGYFDYSTADGNITLHANYDKRTALSMLTDLTEIEREALRSNIVGKNGGAQ